jgi:hypothetical protein
MELERINEILSKIDNIGSVKGIKRISHDEPEDYYEEKYQGGESSQVSIYDIGEESIFLKVVRNTDSYGDNERVTSIQFVKPVRKEVIVYE